MQEEQKFITFGEIPKEAINSSIDKWLNILVNGWNDYSWDKCSICEAMVDITEKEEIEDYYCVICPLQPTCLCVGHPNRSRLNKYYWVYEYSDHPNELHNIVIENFIWWLTIEVEEKQKMEDQEWTNLI